MRSIGSFIVGRHLSAFPTILKYTHYNFDNLIFSNFEFSHVFSHLFHVWCLLLYYTYEGTVQGKIKKKI